MNSHISVLNRSGAVAALSLLALLSVVLYAPRAQAQTTVPLCEISRSLSVGTTGEDVRCLQRYLNWSGVFVATSGAGAPGLETAYYGPRTADAVARWQNTHSAQVLAPLGIPAGTGYWGPSSFAHYVGLIKVFLGA